MTFEEFINLNESLIKVASSGNADLEKITKHLIKNAWKSGYEFRIQEEELNKGASF